MSTLSIVGVGASAGGLRELEVLFHDTAGIKDLAFVVIQHLDPGSDSSLAEIIQRSTDLEVRQVNRKQPVKAGFIYVIPPNKILKIKEGKLNLSPLPKSKKEHSPIDSFFKSLSEDQGDRAIAIILSGSGSDGSEGMRSVKEAGGINIVQKPDSAESSDMPQNALRTGCIDYVAEVDDILKVIKTHLAQGSKKTKERHPEWAVNRTTIQEILSLVERQTDHDFSEYKLNTVERRIDRRLNSLHMHSLEDYLAFLKEDPGEVSKLFKEFLISVTSFFRDKTTFEFIETKIIADIISRADSNGVRIWIPACATGEEAYSFALMFRSYLDDRNLTMKIQIFATDIDLNAIEKARSGYYSKDRVADIPKKLQDKYFLKESEGYRVKKSIRELVVFAEHNLTQDPPYSRLDLIACRNVLIYLNSDLQQKALAFFHYGLKSDGLLILGKAEGLGEMAKYYAVVEKNQKIYRKIISNELSRKISSIRYKPATNEKNYPLIKQKPLSEVAKKFMLEKFMPPAVITNYNGDILYTMGELNEFLEFPTGDLTTNINSLAKKGIKTALNGLIRKVKTTDKAIEIRDVNYQSSGNKRKVHITISPVRHKEAHFLMVVFNSIVKDDNTISNHSTINENYNVVQDLEKELAEKDEILQNSIEEYESTNEELKAANEEAQSTNEELQSTVEELETSKEELQSVNEELITTNQELNLKVDELDRVNNFIHNLYEATDIATIFLDKELKILSFTPAISSIVELLKSDEGRPLRHFTSKIIKSDLLEDSKKVLKTLIPLEDEVRTQSDKYYWMRITPFRTKEDKIEGLVLTFTDINEKKKREKELEEYKHNLERLVDQKTEAVKKSEKEFRIMFEKTPLGAIIYELNDEENLCVAGYNSAASSILKTDISKLTGLQIQKAFPNLDMETIDGLYEIAKSGGSSTTTVNNYLDESHSAVLENFNFQLNTGKVITFFNEVSERINAQNELQKSKLALSHAELIANMGSWEWDVEEDKVTWSNGLYELLQIDPSDGAPSFKDHSTMMNDNDLKELQKVVEKAVNQGEEYELILRYYRPDGSFIYGLAKGKPVKNEAGMVTHLNGTLQDITAMIQKRELEERASRLKSINESKDLIFRIISHDLRSPLHSSLALLDLLIKKDHSLTQEEENKFMEALHKNTQDLVGLIENLVHWATTSKMNIKKDKINAKQYSEYAVEILQNKLKEKNITLKNNISDEITIYVDVNAFETIMRNLVHNAIKFSDKHSVIEINADEMKNGTVITVRDQGTGMTEEELEQILNPTSKFSKPGTTGENGIGLGLQLTLDLLDKNDASLDIESDKGKGTTVKMTFTYSNDEDLVPENATKNDPEEKHKILVVDDQLLASFHLKRIIEEITSQYTVITAENGLEAVELIKKNGDIELVFMDINMPKMNGFQSTRLIKKLNKDIKIIIQSGLTDKDSIKKANEAGCDDFITKPFNTMTINSMLEKYLKLDGKSK